VRRGPAPTLAAVAVAAVVLAVAPAGALARAATAAQVRALAARAADDPAALRTLRSIDTVDGRPADVAAALGDARGAALSARLRILAGAAAGGAGDASPAEARRQARAVLSERRFRRTFPQPLRRPLERLGTWVRDLVDGLPGGPGGRWAIAIVVVAILAAVVSLRGVRRRRGVRGGGAGAHGPGGVAAEGADALERRADEAERAGDHALAVRLRFRAGLMRLGERDVIPYRPSLTTAEARRRLHSEPFDRLAADFDAIAYGGRAAGDDDARAAREGWHEVLGAGAR
jgi:hypothetical protein